MIGTEGRSDMRIEAGDLTNSATWKWLLELVMLMVMNDRGA